MKKEKLTKEERIKLYRLSRFSTYSIRAIARELGRAHTTVIRELRRNKVDRNRDYYTQAELANEAAKTRRQLASCRMRLKCREIRWYVEFHLKQAEWSPEIIAGKLTTLGYPISAEAIYQYINVERPDLKGCLLVAGKSKRRRRSKKRRVFKLPAAPKRSIEILPLKSKLRTEIGHFELDAIEGKKGKSVLQNKVDRKSRKIFLDKSGSLKAKEYSDILISRIQRDVPIIKTILQDNGHEHAEHQRVDTVLGIESFFCHPQCASERGTVENRNKAARRFLPKGTDFDDIPDEYIEWVEDYLNNMPMKILGFKTPNQVWFEELKKAA